MMPTPKIPTPPAQPASSLDDRPVSVGSTEPDAPHDAPHDGDHNQGGCAARWTRIPARTRHRTGRLRPATVAAPFGLRNPPNTD
ncbi:MAG: hypothetical protein WDN30_08865 [Pararobbsia sp.]